MFLFSAVNFLKEQSLQVLGIESTLNVTPVLREIAKRTSQSGSTSSQTKKPTTSEATPNKEVSKKSAKEETAEKDDQSFPAAANAEIRYGFVQKFITDRAFGFIRCVGEGREAPSSELDHSSVKNMKKGSEVEGKWQDVYFKKRNVDTASGKTDFFKRKGTPVKFTLATVADNRTEAQMVQFFEIVAKQDTPVDIKSDKCDTAQPIGATPGQGLDDSSANEASGSNVQSEPAAKQTCDYASSPPSLIKELQDHHDEKEEEIFFNQLFDCMVCFATKPGAKSIRFPGTFPWLLTLHHTKIFLHIACLFQVAVTSTAKPA